MCVKPLRRGIHDDKVKFVPSTVQRNWDEREPMVEQAIAMGEVELMEEMPYSLDTLDILKVFVHILDHQM